MGISEILDTYPAERIDNAAVECDFTATELMDEVRKLRNNQNVKKENISQHIYASILGSFEAIADCLHDEDEEEATCSRCGGSGGGEDDALRCPACRGTGRS